MLHWFLRPNLSHPWLYCLTPKSWMYINKGHLLVFLMFISPSVLIGMLYFCLFFIYSLLSNHLWTLLYNQVAYSLLCLLIVMVLCRICTTSMFAKSYWWAYLLLVVHLISSRSMAVKLGNALIISTMSWSSSTMPWDTCLVSLSASIQIPWSVIATLLRGLLTY